MEVGVFVCFAETSAFAPSRKLGEKLTEIVVTYDNTMRVGSVYQSNISDAWVLLQ